MKTYEVDILEFGYEDLSLGKSFYENQLKNLGSYFTNSVLTDIEALSFYAGIHPKYYGFYRMLAKRFPYAIYYDIKDDVAVVYAILDLRSNPKTNKAVLSKRVS